MKKKVLVLSVVLAIVMVLLVPMSASAEDINITIGSETVSCTVSPGAWDVGTIAAASPETTWESGVEGFFTLTNTGSVTEDFTIEGTDASGSSVTWTLSTSPATANEYSLGFGQAVDPYTTEPTYTLFDTGGTTLTSGLVVDGTFKFDLQLNTYTGTDVTQVMTANVTITAVVP